MDNNTLIMGKESSFFIENLKNLIEKVVDRYVNNNVVPSREKEDVVMTIMEKFLKNRKKIDDAYEGKSKIRTYYIAIFNRMCCEVIRKESKYWYSVKDNEEDTSSENGNLNYSDAEKKLIIDDELKRLSIAMVSLGKEEAKLNLFLKYYFGLPITPGEIDLYSLNHNHKISSILNGFPPRNKADILNNLARLISIAEGKIVKGDAVRIWLHKRINMILDKINLNGNANHNKESLQILLEMQRTY